MNSLQNSNDLSVPVRISHLGITFGHENQGRVIALSSSEVYGDSELIPAFLNVLPASLDNGFQAQLYSDPSDTLIVSLQEIDDKLMLRSADCIRVNAAIWKTLTGINLAKENVVIAYNRKKNFTGFSPKRLQLRKGSLSEVAFATASETGKALVAFVLSRQFVKKSGLGFPPENAIWDYANATELLMNKNKTMQILEKYGVPVPLTYFSGKNKKSIDKTRKYVFKPAGGAAGLGIYLNDGSGAGWDDIQIHIKMLESSHLLPAEYQIQEYITGPVYGALVLFLPGKKPEILQIHEQIISEKNKFIAGYWTPEYQNNKWGVVEKLVNRIAAIKEIKFIGLMGIDIVNGKVIEINPRITASSPVSHLLANEQMIKDFIGSDFKMDRIDINAGISVPHDLISSGQLTDIIFGLWSKHRVLVLPQGLNPAGNSRVLFINDTIQNSVQQKFLEVCSRKF